MVTIIEVAAPQRADDPNGWAALAEAHLWNAEFESVLGYPDLNDTDAAAVRLAMPSDHVQCLRWVALADPDDHDSVLAAGSIRLPLKDNLSTGEVGVIVRPDARRQGIGTRLMEVIRARALDIGRTTLQAWTTHPAGVDESTPGALRPAEGTGAIDSAAPSARYLRSLGFTLEQVEVHSMLRVPVPPEVIDPLEAEAAARVGADYRLVTWAGACPEQQLDAFAVLRAAMVDAPSAGMDWQVEHWDAARVREREQRTAESGLLTLTCAAEQVSSGELVGYTELERFAERPDSAMQQDTVVIRQHRGHRLGMHLKTANLRRLGEHWPAVRRIHTWNADENDYMRSINIALGFRPESNEAAWQQVNTLAP